MGDGTDPLAETVVDMPTDKGEKDPMVSLSFHMLKLVV